jgi:hypothetical protein
MKNNSKYRLDFGCRKLIGREGEALLHEYRINFLIKLSVLALQYPVYGLFEDTAQWLNKVFLAILANSVNYKSILDKWREDP